MQPKHASRCEIWEAFWDNLIEAQLPPGQEDSLQQWVSQPSCEQALLQLEGLTSWNHSKPAQILGAASGARDLQDPSSRAKVCVTERAVHPSWGCPTAPEHCPQSGPCLLSSLIRIRACDSLSVCLSVPSSQVSTTAVIHNQVLTPRDTG